MKIDIGNAFDSIKDGIDEATEMVHKKTNEFHEEFISKAIPDCGKYGDAAKFAVEMIPGVAEYNAIKDGDWQEFAIAAGIDIASLTIGVFTAGTGYGFIKGGSAVAKVGVKSATKEIAEAGTKKIVKEIAESGTKKVVKEVAETGTKKVVKEVAETGTKKAVKEVSEAGAKKVVQEVTEAGTKKAVEEVAETGAKKAVKELTETGTKKVVKETAEEGTGKVIKEVAEEGVEKSAKETAESSVEKAAREGTEKTIKETREVIGKELTLQQKNELRLNGMSDNNIENCTYKDGVYQLRTINEKLEGQVLGNTEIRYNRKTIDYFGKKVSAVFPEFESICTVQLPEGKLRDSDKVQFTECTTQLKKEISQNTLLKDMFTPRELEEIAYGKLPVKYVWHHNEEIGKMELVLREIHEVARHTGGKSIWGGGSQTR